MQTWEYIIYTYTAHASVDVRTTQLDSLGNDGWELVSVMYNAGIGLIEYTLKRPMI